MYASLQCTYSFDTKLYGIALKSHMSTVHKKWSFRVLFERWMKKIAILIISAEVLNFDF
jgi:hypothetical protein